MHWYLKFDMCLKEKNRKYFLLPPKKIFPFFSQTSKSGWNDGNGDGENFLIENFVEN